MKGTASNRSAIGATVRLIWDDMQKIKEVSGGDAFSSQSQRAVHFGLEELNSVSKVEIRWPSGTVQTIDHPDINTVHSITEPQDA